MMVLEVLQIYTVGVLLIGLLTYDGLRTSKGLWTNGTLLTRCNLYPIKPFFSDNMGIGNSTVISYSTISERMASHSIGNLAQISEHYNKLLLSTVVHLFIKVCN